MPKYWLKAIQPHGFVPPRTADSRHAYPISPNLLLDRRKSVGSNEVWVGDITYILMTGSRWTLRQHATFKMIEDARTEIFEFIEMYYNTNRLHSSLDYQGPDEYEKQSIFEAHKQGNSALPKE